MDNTVKKLLLIMAVLALVYSGYTRQVSVPSGQPVMEAAQTDAALLAAIESHSSDVQVRGVGVVSKLLADDNQGSRHQRFIVRLATQQTLLIAHNIDLAPRVDGLREGDTVEFNGEYEWNPQGGVVHWTHHDPDGRHPGGWLKHHGRIFQ